MLRTLQTLFQSPGLRERYTGSLLGLACGDAVGTTVEFQRPGRFVPVTDMTGGGPFGLRAGEWTDDTSMALCLAESLIECSRFDPADQMQRYVRWRHQGHLSSTGECFDIGNTVAAALRAFQASGDPYSGSTHPRHAGNGSIMRLAPVPLFFGADPAQAVYYSGESSRTTHGALTCVDACRYMGGIIAGLLRGDSKAQVLAANYSPVPGLWKTAPLCPEIAEIAAGSFKHRKPPEIVGGGYVVKALEAALWAFFKSKDFRSGCLLAVNLGDDADTTAAIYGQIAGACYGAGGIPRAWREKVAYRGLVEGFAVRLLALRP